MAKIFIDTEIWSFGLKKPDKSDPENIINRFTIANNFIVERIKNDQIFITTHQICEIFHVLSFRGKKLPIEFTISYIEHLLSLSNISTITIATSHLKRAFLLSKTSGIHIWDYLCIIPLIHNLDIIYTCDKHFNTESFQKLKIPIQNPLNFWLEL